MVCQSLMFDFSLQAQFITCNLVLAEAQVLHCRQCSCLAPEDSIGFFPDNVIGPQAVGSKLLQ